MTHLVFICRPHAEAVERAYALGDGELAVSETGKPTVRIPLGDITKVALSYMGTGQRQTYCTITFRSGGKVRLSTHHFVSLGEFEDRRESFDAFVTALCRGVAAHNPQAAFTSGSWLYFWNWLLVFLVTSGLATYFLNEIVSTGQLEAEAVMGVVVATGVALTTLGAAIANRVESFDPEDPPLRA